MTWDDLAAAPPVGSHLPYPGWVAYSCTATLVVVMMDFGLPVDVHPCGRAWVPAWLDAVASFYHGFPHAFGASVATLPVGDRATARAVFALGGVRALRAWWRRHDPAVGP